MTEIEYLNSSADYFQSKTEMPRSTALDYASITLSNMTDGDNDYLDSDYVDPEGDADEEMSYWEE